MHLARAIALALLLAVAVAGLIVAWGDWPAVVHALGRFPLPWIAPVLLLTIWNYALRYLRWNWYLHTLGVDDIDARSSALVFLSGFAMGLTPGKSGEVTKSYWLRELAGPEHATVARTEASVFAERLVDGTAMSIFMDATTGCALLSP